MMNNMQKPIMIWAVPRSISTAFERAFMQREDTITLHEPFGEAYAYGPERISKRLSEEQCAKSPAKDVRYSDVLHSILSTQANSDGKLVVVKDFARRVILPDRIAAASQSNPSVLSDEDLKKFRHTFLIRTPQKTLPSFYKALESVAFLDGFDPIADPAFVELQALVEYTRRLLPDEPLVLIDSADLISEPERTLRAFCSAIEIPFDKKMLSWEAKHIPIFDKWKHFHEDAQNSTGFKEIPRKEFELPKTVSEAIEATMPVYESLQKLKLKV